MTKELLQQALNEAKADAIEVFTYKDGIAQSARDAIEYMHSWLGVYFEKQALAQQEPSSEMLACDIDARPLAYPLRDYHTAPSDGPLNFTWKDKPHRLLYDLIAAVKFYAKAQQEQPSDSEYARGFADGQKEFAEIAGGAWQTAVIDQLVVHHIYQAIHDTDPRKAVHDLLCISNDIALDPQVSSDAQALVDRGRGEAQQDQPDQQLCSFYQVDSFPALVAAQEQHIQKLQAKLAKPANPFHPLNSREG